MEKTKFWTMDSAFEMVNRVYFRKGCCPTIQTCSGGNRQPKVIKHYGEIHRNKTSR